MKIRNIGSTDVLVTMGQTDPSHVQIPTDTDEVLKSGGWLVISLATTGGCSKMYVWSLAKKLVWCGIVPLGSGDSTEIPLILNADIKKVTYSGLDVPECPEIRSQTKEYFTAIGDNSSDGIDFFMIVVVLTIFFVIYGIGSLIYR